MFEDACAVGFGVVEEVVVGNVAAFGADVVSVEAADFGEEEVGGRHSGSVDGGGVAFQGVAGDEGLDGVLGGAYSLRECVQLLRVCVCAVGEVA